MVLEGPPETACPDPEFVASPELSLLDEPVPAEFGLPVETLRELDVLTTAPLFAVCRIVVIAEASPQAQEVKASTWVPVGSATYVTHAVGLKVENISPWKRR